MPNPIGISFMPSEENQALGPQRAGLEGQGGSDLADAFKILSLRLPQVLGARSLAPQRLLTSPGSSALPPAFDPNSEIFKTLIRTMLGGMAPPAGLPGGYGGGGQDPMTPPNYDPHFVPGNEQMQKFPEPPPPQLQSPTPPAPSPGGGLGGDQFRRLRQL